jgi:starch synthase
MASLLPVYLKHYYKDEGIFEDTKVITSIYAADFEGTLDTELITKLAFDNLPQEAISKYKEPVFTNLMKATIDHSDAIIIASENVSADLTKYIETSKKPFLPFTPKESLKEAYLEFLKNKL